MSGTTHHTVDPKFTYFDKRIQKDVVRYIGLLDAAHRAGLVSIATDILAYPCEENNQTCIVRATVILDSEDRGLEITAIGDANPKNVGAAIAPHFIRMAECVPLHAQILTREGWKYHEWAQLGEDVLAYDVEMDTCRWTPLLDKSVYMEPHPTLVLESQSFRVECTSSHTWATEDYRKRRTLRQAHDLKPSHKIIQAARAESGDHVLSPREAALLGWLATDGTVRETMVGQYGPYKRATIAQSKPAYLGELRELVGTDGTVQVSAARQRTFPAGYTSDCLPQHKFELTAKFTRELFDKAGIGSFSQLPELVTRLSSEARAAMLDAMLKGDGALKPNGRWTFGQKAKPGVSEAFTILATMEGIALGKPRTSSVGDVPVQTLRKTRLIGVDYLSITWGVPQPVWCPTTRYGTWIMNLDGYITITGNTRAKARALRDALNIGMVSVEELGGEDHDEDARSYPPQGRTFAEASASGIGPWDDDHTPPRRPPAFVAPRPAPAPAAPQAADQGNERATERQVKFIRAIGAQAGLDEAALERWCQELHACSIEQLNRRDASTFMEALQRRRAEREGQTTPMPAAPATVKGAYSKAEMQALIDQAWTDAEDGKALGEIKDSLNKSRHRMTREQMDDTRDALAKIEAKYYAPAGVA